MVYGDDVYGDTSPYGGGSVAPPSSGGGTSSGDHSGCLCRDGWRFEATELGGPNAGRVKAVLHPISVSFEEAYSRVGTGDIVLATEDPSAEDIWAGSTGLYISQVMPDGSRRPRFGAYVEKWNGAGGGATTTAFQSIEDFLKKRLIVGPASGYKIDSSISGPDQLFVVGKPISPTATQTLLTKKVHGQAGHAAALVDLARGGLEGEGFTGIPTLTAVADAPVARQQLRPVQWWDHKNVAQEIREMIEAENGVKYWLEHVYTDPGYWSTIMHFSDVVGVDRDYTLLSDREGWQYGLEVDASDKATRVYGLGSGEEGNVMFSVAYDDDGIDNLPEHQVSVSWKDQTDANTLNSLTKGYVIDHRDPTAIPSMSIVGLPTYDPDSADFDPQRGFPAPEICRPGDTFNVELGYGVITVRDIRVRNLAVAWKLEQGSPVERVLAMQPIIRANQSVRTQTPAKPPAPTEPVPPNTPGVPVADPWPTPGRLVNIKTSDLTEISGMEIQHTTPGGYVWVLEDEFETPDQVSCVSRKTGELVGWFAPNPGVSAAPVGDPEAIRYSYKSKKLVIADTGDNNLSRPTSGPNQPHLLVVTEPPATFKGTIPATKLPIAYPGGKRWNVETLLIHTKTDEVLLVTKEANRAQVFSYGPLSAMSTVNNVGTLVATLTNINTVADGTHVPSSQFVLFRSATRQPTIVYRTSDWVKVAEIATPAMTKCEAITFESTCAFFVTTEGMNPPIYRVLIPTKFGATCTTTGGDSGTPAPPTNPNAQVPGQLIPMADWKLQLPI